MSAAENRINTLAVLEEDGAGSGPISLTNILPSIQEWPESEQVANLFLPSHFHDPRPWWKTQASRIASPFYSAVEEEPFETFSLASWQRSQVLLGQRSYLSLKSHRISRHWKSLVLISSLTLNFVFLFVDSFRTSDSPSDWTARWERLGTGTEGLSWYPTNFLRNINPIPCHSHNDYWRDVPLFSALHAGCTGVEADVWLVDDELYVGHTLASLSRNRTLRSLYINPLLGILNRQANANGFFSGDRQGLFDMNPSQQLVLLIDVKTDASTTWTKVMEQLEPLREGGWLTFVENDELMERPLVVVGTGNIRLDHIVTNDTYRDAFLDAPLERMWEPLDPFTTEEDDNPWSWVASNEKYNHLNSYYASVSFWRVFGATWYGHLSEHQSMVLHGQIRGAHRRGLKVRYWDLPSWPTSVRNHIWHLLVDEGVDYLNFDDLEAARRQIW